MDSFQVKKFFLIVLAVPLFLYGAFSLYNLGATVKARTGTGTIVGKYIRDVVYPVDKNGNIIITRHGYVGPGARTISKHSYYLRLDNNNEYEVNPSFYNLAHIYDSVKAYKKQGSEYDSYIFLTLFRSDKIIGSSVYIDATGFKVSASSYFLMLPLLGAVFLKGTGGLFKIIVLIEAVVYSMGIVVFIVQKVMP